jgi:phosphohistidine phosphatase SixA
MYILRLPFLVTTAVLYFCVAPMLFAQSVSKAQFAVPELVEALQAGGHIIYMRHAKTDLMQKNSTPNRLKSCNLQRNLSEAGRHQAQRIGQIMASLKIPVGEVLSSPYCRCKDTAQLAFGKNKIDLGLQFSLSKNEKKSKQLGEYLHNLMRNITVTSGNAVIVGHTSNLRDGLGVWPKPEGVVVVFKNDADKIIYKGMIKPDAWPNP